MNCNLDIKMPPMPLFYFGIPSRSDIGWIMAQISILPEDIQQSVAQDYSSNYLKYGQIHSNTILRNLAIEHGGEVPELLCDKRNLQAQLIISKLPPAARLPAVLFHKKVFDDANAAGKYGSEVALSMLKAAMKKHCEEVQYG